MAMVRHAELFGKSGYKDVTFKVVAYNHADLALSVITFVTPRGTYTITEGTNWNDGDTDDVTTATNLKTAIEALAFVESAQVFADTSSDGVIHVMPHSWADITSVTWNTAAGATISSAAGVLTQTETGNYVSVPENGGTRNSNMIRIGDAEYHSVSVIATVDGAGTPEFELDYRVSLTQAGIDVNGLPASVVWSEWREIVSAGTASDGAWKTYDAEFTPPTGEWVQFRYTNNHATLAITATATTGLRGIYRGQ